MKELQFSTEKGEFLLLDGKDTITERLTELLKEYEHYSVVRDMTEEQFVRVVDSHYSLLLDYNTREYTYQISARESFESLVKSLGWSLRENPYRDPGLIPSAELDLYRKTNDKVFFNPILLKKI